MGGEYKSPYARGVGGRGAISTRVSHIQTEHPPPERLLAQGALLRREERLAGQCAFLYFVWPRFRDAPLGGPDSIWHVVFRYQYPFNIQMIN